MSHFDSDTFRQEVIDIVRQIPRGRVLTYGLIARLAGYPLHARHVGKALHGVEDKAIPCHRVVNSVGRTAPDWPEQRLLLKKKECISRRMATLIYGTLCGRLRHT